VKLAPRLLLLGVGLPLVGLVAALVIASLLFRTSLLSDVDRRLLGQAAVESVSLFDGPNNEPHLHMSASPLATQVAEFAPEAVLVDAAGLIVIPNERFGQRWPMPLATTANAPELSTNDNTRTLTVGVMRPKVGVYTLYLRTSLASVDTTMRSFYRAIGLTMAVIAVVLSLILLLQARQLVRRIQRLIALVPIIRKGELPPAVPETPGEGHREPDELAELSAVLTETARALHHQQQAQEQFLANAAHQLRTPLAVLRTEIELALRRPREHAELKAALEMANTETARLTLLARKLLDFESLRSQTVELQSQPLLPLVTEVLERQQHSASAKRITLVAPVPVDVAVNCDRLLLTQALENIVDNALRFAPLDTEVTVTVAVSATKVEVLVHDDGPGIPAAEQDRIFEPFFRGSTPGSQTGLGLAFVADVARRHGGQAVLVATTRGTTIGFSLPRAR
jgi:signal transduction histidine kinase